MKRALSTAFPAASSLGFALLAATLAGAGVAACGGGGTDAPPPATPAAAPPAPKAADTGPKPADKPDSDKVTWKRDPSFAKCHNDVKTGADLVAGVTAMAQGCAAPMKMHQIGQTVQSSAATSTRRSPSRCTPRPTTATACTACPRTRCRTSTSPSSTRRARVRGEDGSDSPDAVVLEDGAVCFTAADDVKVNVAARQRLGQVRRRDLRSECDAAHQRAA